MNVDDRVPYFKLIIQMEQDWQQICEKRSHHKATLPMHANEIYTIDSLPFIFWRH